MILEAWQQGQQFISFDDNEFSNDYCSRQETLINTSEVKASMILISLKGCLIMYANHKSTVPQIVSSRQNSDIGILSFQLHGDFKVDERDFTPYRIFQDDIHNTFFTNRRELIFEAPLQFENFRIILSPESFKELLAKFHGRFSEYADKIRMGEYFNLYENPLPITPRMKMIIHEVITHKIKDTLLSKVFYDTKITELFGCQLEQLYADKQKENLFLNTNDRNKIQQAKELLIRNLENEHLSIRQLARLTGTNENKLKKGFKELYGRSIYNYLLHYRINKAIDLMKIPELTIEEIASKTGYGDAAHFSRAFSKVKGIPPGQYRKQIDVRNF